LAEKKLALQKAGLPNSHFCFGHAHRSISAAILFYYVQFYSNQTYDFFVNMSDTFDVS